MLSPVRMCRTWMDIQVLDVVADPEPPNFQVLGPLGSLRVGARENGALVVAKQPGGLECLFFGDVFRAHGVSPHLREFIRVSAGRVLLGLCILAYVVNCGDGESHLGQQSSCPDSFVSCETHGDQLRLVCGRCRDGLQFGLPGNQAAVDKEAVAGDGLAAVLARVGVIRIGHAK